MKMKTLLLSLWFPIIVLPAGLAEKVVLPEKYLTEQLKWADAGETPQIRADRLEAFWFAHLPRENGGENPEAPGGYEDGTHGSSIVYCAWQLTRAYIESGQKDKALHILNWLAKYESKTGLAPVTERGEQDGAGQPATRPQSKSEDGGKPQPEAEGRSR